MKRRFVFVPLFCAFGMLLPSGCTRLYYASMEKIGKEKRDILVKRISEGKKDQEEAREQIKTTMETFKELTGFEGGNLEKAYNRMNGDYEDARSRADDVSSRIKSIDQVAGDLFKEWEKEISEISNTGLKARSRSMLRDAQGRHRRYMTAMHATERKMAPVLNIFHDQVLYLKHNLNARAINSLKGQVTKLDEQVSSLVLDMEKSIAESDEFVRSLTAPDQTS
jgi:hypothetical protein